MSELARSGNEVSDAARARPQLSAEQVALLHAALETDLGSRDPKSSSELKHAIRRISTDAKQNNWPPESLLVALKAAAHSLPALQRLPRGPERDELVAHLVSLCIDEYYGGSVSGTRGSVRSPTSQ